MASPISGLTPYATQHGDDFLIVVDTHDATMASAGTDKKATMYQVFGSPSNNQLIMWVGSTTGIPVGVTIGSGLTLSGGQLTATNSNGGTVTAVSVASANGFTGSVSTATSTPAITLGTSITGILKGNGTAIAAATAGADFQAPITLTTTGSSGAATFSNGTLNIPQYSAGSGTVTTASVVSANGFAGTVANASTSPAITISTTATGMLKGASGAIAAATAGADYQAPISLTTTGSSGAATFSGGTLNIPQYPPGTVTTASVVSANGFSGSVANATSTPAITITTSVSGILKGNGTAIAAATAGTDYQVPITLTTTGTSGAATFSAGTLNIPQYSGGSGSGTVSSGATNQIAYYASSGTSVSGLGIGSGLSISGGNLVGTGGTVTAASVVSANGFSGTVANASTTPAITVSTSVSGMLKGNGTAISAATAGTDYVVPSGNITGTAAGLSSTLAVGSGGTGATALTGILKGNGTSAVTAAAPGTDYQAPIGLTTTGSGAATFSSNTLNIPQNGVVSSGTANQLAVYAANGTTVSGTNTGLQINSHYGAITADTDGSTITFNLATSNWHSVTLGGNRTLAISNPAVGQQFTLILTQDGTGSRTVTWFSGITWMSGSAPTLQTAPGAIDVITFKCTASGVYLGFSSSAPTVTTVSVVGANGFTGSVANATTTPAITLGTSITGVLKGNGTAIAAATAGTDYQAPITLTTTGTGGPATFSAGTLNIPQYSGGSGSGTVNSGTSGQVAYYNATGTAVSGEGLSTLIDSSLSSTPGSFLVRGGSLWAPPAGLSYDNANNCPKLAQIADPATPAAGDLWSSSVSGGLAFARSSSIINRVGGPIYQCGACTPATNTTSWTSLLQSPAWSVGSLTLPASSLVAGNLLDLKLYGAYSTASGSTLALRVLLGGTVIAVTPAPSSPGSISGNAVLPSFPLTIFFNSVGSGGSAICGGRMLLVGSSSMQVIDLTPNAFSAGGSVAVNTTSSLLLDIQAQWSTASSSNSIALNGFVLSMS